MSEEVLFERGDGIARLTINRPEARNALNQAVRDGLFDGLRTFIEDDNSWGLDSYVNLDLRFGLATDQWEVLVYVDNALDDDTVRSGGTGPGIAFGDFRTGALIDPAFGTGLGTTVIAAPALPSSFYANMPDKRLVGLRASYRF